MEFQPFIAAFTGTAIEFFETMVICYALIRAGFLREAGLAVVLGHILVFSLAIFFSPLLNRLPVFWLQLMAALLLTSMRAYWFFKSAKRLYRHQRPGWVADPIAAVGLDKNQIANPTTAFSIIAFLAMAKSSVVEALEIVIVAMPVYSSTGALFEVLGGVGLAIMTVTALSFLLHQRLKNIPEVKLKLAVGLILFTLGVNWLIELD